MTILEQMEDRRKNDLDFYKAEKVIIRELKKRKFDLSQVSMSNMGSRSWPCATKKTSFFYYAMSKESNYPYAHYTNNVLDPVKLYKDALIIVGGISGKIVHKKNLTKIGRIKLKMAKLSKELEQLEGDLNLDY